jgi:hypothetical protein
MERPSGASGQATPNSDFYNMLQTLTSKYKQWVADGKKKQPRRVITAAGTDLGVGGRELLAHMTSQVQMGGFEPKVAISYSTTNCRSKLLNCTQSNY